MTVESMANSRELASACEKLSMITGLHPGQPLSSHLDKLAELTSKASKLEAEVEYLTTEKLADYKTSLRVARGLIENLEKSRDHWEAEVRKTDALLIQALTKRDDARAEAKRYRDRCPVTAEDVEAAGVTPAHASEWARTAGWRESDGEDWPLSPRPFGLLRLSRPGEKRECTACLFDDGAEDNPGCVARVCNEAAKGDPRAPLDILNEMAAEVPK